MIWVVPYFLAGILACKHRKNIHGLLQIFPGWARDTLLVVPLAIFMLRFDYLNCFLGLLYCLGASMVIVSAVEAPTFRKILMTKPLRWAGRISYSLYLVHLPILFWCFTVLHGLIHPAWIFLFTVATSFGAAALVHKWVEQPASRLGHLLARSPKVNAASSKLPP